MSIQLKSSGKGYRLNLSGEIGYAQVNELYQVAQQIAENPKPTTIEWENLHAIHYAGIQVLIALSKSLQNHNLPLRYKEPAPDLYAQLERYGLWHAMIES